MQKLQVPLCFDHHNHISYYLLLAQCPSLSGIEDKTQALEAIRQACADQSRQALTLITGWHSGRLPLEAEDLAEFPPVIVLNYCLHGFLMNEAATALTSSLGLNLKAGTALEAERSMPELFFFFSHFVDDPQQASTELTQKAQEYISSLKASGLYGAQDMLQLRPNLVAAWSEANDFGIESWEYPQAIVYKNRQKFLMTVDPSETIHSECFPVITHLEHSALISNHPGFNYKEKLPGITPQVSKKTKPRLRFKLFGDGAIGSRTAALAAGFTTDSKPTLIFSTAELEECLMACYTADPTGEQETAIAYHAIGELAIAQILCAYSLVKWRLGALKDLRLRLEHVQFITLEQAHIAKQLGIVLCMQPNFSEDSVTYADRLSLAQRQANNPFRMLIDQVGFVPGEDLLFGSDGMPSGIKDAVQQALFPPYPSQKLTLEELLAGYKGDYTYGHLELEIDEEQRQVRMVEA